MSVVEFSSVSKSYPLASTPARRLATTIAPSLFRTPQFTALSNVSFRVERGETFCILGRNGAGKSTLLQLVAGISQPSAGTVRVGGRIAALLELGSGFHADFTGRENIRLSAAIAGFSGAETRRLLPRIESFADIGDFIDRPVRTYSSGMLVRLAFSVAIHVEPEILIVDEALSVGDQAFRQRCLRKVAELRTRGVTVLFVSHSVADVKALGDRALWLEHGATRALGPAADIAEAYINEMTGAPKQRTEDAVDASTIAWLDNAPRGDGRTGDARATICGFALYDGFGRCAAHLSPGGRYRARISFVAHDALSAPRASLLIRNHLGIEFCGASTRAAATPLPALQKNERATVDFDFTLPEFYPGSFSFSPSIADADALCDRIDNALTLQMERSSGEVYGYLHVPARVRWTTPPLAQEVRRA